MPAPYRYATVRIVPRVDREEFVNAGVILCSPERRYLAAGMRVEEERWRALWPALDVEGVRPHLEAVLRICRGDPDGGPIARMPLKERFHWLTAPRSTVIQVSPVRTGLADALDEELRRLMEAMVS